MQKLARIERRRKHRDCKNAPLRSKAREIEEPLMDSQKMRMRKELMSKTCLGCRTLSNLMELITTRELNSSQLLRLLRYLKRSLHSSKRVRPITRYQVQLLKLNLLWRNLPNLIPKKINLIQQELQLLPRLKKTQRKQKVKT